MLALADCDGHLIYYFLNQCATNFNNHLANNYSLDEELREELYCSFNPLSKKRILL